MGNKIKSPRKAEIKVVLKTKEQKMSVLTTFRKCFAHGIFFFLNKVVKVKNLRCTDQKHFASVIWADFTEYILHSDLKVPCFLL